MGSYEELSSLFRDALRGFSEATINLQTALIYGRQKEILFDEAEVMRGLRGVRSSPPDK
jgi:hypothetical protein